MTRGKEDEERKLKSDEELLAEADPDSHSSLSRSVSHYLTAEYERLSSPLGLGDSEADVSLDSEFSFPQWFVDGCSALLSLRAVQSGGQWMIAGETRRRTSSIGVVTADGRSDAALPTYRPWRSGAEWFDDSERQQHVARKCLPTATYEQLAGYMDRRAEQLGKAAVSLTKARCDGGRLISHRAIRCCAICPLRLCSTLQRAFKVSTHCWPTASLCSTSLARLSTLRDCPQLSPSSIGVSARMSLPLVAASCSLPPGSTSSTSVVAATSVPSSSACPLLIFASTV